MSDLLQDALEWLDRCGIAYMVVGSVASSVYGLSRATQDIDVVVDISAEQVQQLAALLPDDRYYVSVDAGMQALRYFTQFNIIDTRSGGKVDLIPCKPRPFSQVEFSRRRKMQTALGDLVLASPEDVVISKLEWNSISASDRQLRDVQSILEVHSASLDWNYLRKWAAELGVLQQLEQVAEPDKTA